MTTGEDLVGGWRNVLAVQHGALGEGYLARWCGELDLTELLDEARLR